MEALAAIQYIDGHISIESNSTDSDDSNLDDSDTEYVTDEEVDPEVIAANLSPIPDENVPTDGPPIKLDVIH